MGLVHADRVKETSTTTGTGTYSLAGAVAGFRTFVAGIGNGNRCIYCVENGNDWELNEGIVTDAAPDTLARTRFLASSTGAAISWTAGTRNVFCVAAAAARNPRTRALLAAHAISAIAATEVTGLQLTNIEPGVYQFAYHLFIQAATTAISPMLGVNFSGTVSKNRMTLRYPGTGTAASTGVVDDVVATMLATGNVYEGQPVVAFTTTAPNMGISAGIAAINLDAYVVIEGLMVVTAAGTLSLWHGSETATSTTVSIGSSVILTRIDD